MLVVIEGFDPDLGWNPSVELEDGVVSVTFPEFPVDWLIKQALLDENGHGFEELMEKHSGFKPYQEDREYFVFGEDDTEPEVLFAAVEKGLMSISALRQ